MQRVWVSAVLMVLVSLVPCRAFELTSPDFKDSGQLPEFCSCAGSGTAPGLAWAGAPAGTKSFALTCIDPDAPRGDFVHWIVYDIPASAVGIARGGVLPEGSHDLANDYEKQGFGPACPPSGAHRYVFTLYALSREKLGGVARQEFFTAVRQYRLGSATLTGLYKRK